MVVAVSRPSKEQFFSDMALLVSRRSTCHRLAVGCVLVNERGHVLSTGYNGVAAGLPHCNESSVVPRQIKNPNPYWRLQGGAEYVTEYISEFPNRCQNSDAPLGQPNGCESIHAEQNALLQCPDVYKIHTCYVTHSPCVTCVKLLLNTGCERIVYRLEYPHANAKQLWLASSKPSTPASVPWSLETMREWLIL